MSIQTLRAAYRGFFALLTLAAVVVQFLYVAGRPTFSAVNFFSFFTIESNILAALVFLAAALLPSWRDQSSTFDLVRGAATLYMVTTGIVYVLLLSGLEEALQTQIPWVNLVLHYIMPIVVFLDWVTDTPRQNIPYTRALIWLAFPLLYFGYSLVRGPFVNWYPYPFLNPETVGGYVGVALYALGITAAVLVLIGLLVLVTRGRPRPTTKARIAGLAVVLTAAAVIAAAVPGSVAAAGLSSASRVGPSGVGPIVFGMTPAQAAATGTRFTATKPARGSTCYYLRQQTIRGLRFMVEHGTIRRAEVTADTIATTDGFRVGDAGSKVAAFYGSRARVGPDKYDPTAQTITILPRGPADSKYRMVFVVKDGWVGMIITGALPQVLYVEGCS